MKKTRWNSWIRAGLWIASVAVGLIYLHEYNWLGSMLVHYSFYILFGYLCLLAIHFFQHSKNSLVKFHWIWCGLFIGWFTYIFVQLPVQKSNMTRVNDATKYRLATWNVNVYSESKVALLEAAKALNPDIFCIQELNTVTQKFLTPSFLTQVTFPLNNNYFGNGIFVQQPILKADTIVINANGHVLLRIQLALDSQKITIYSVHLLPPLSPDNFRTGKKTFAALTEIIVKDSLPKIICGDFNSTTYAIWFRELLDNGKLVKVRSQPFYRKTWRLGFLPILELDHVLMSQSAFDVFSFDIKAFGPSDHRLMCIDFSVRKH